MWRVMSHCFGHWDPCAWWVEYRCCQCYIGCHFVSGIETLVLDELNTDAVSVTCYVFLFQALSSVCLMCWVQMLSVWCVMSFCFRHWDPFSWCVEYRCCQCDMLCLFVPGIKTCLLDVLSTDAVSVRCYVFLFQAFRPVCLTCWVQMLSVWHVMSFCSRH